MGGFWLPALIIFFIAIAATRSFAPFIPIFLLLFVILPAMRRSRWGESGDFEKPKNDFDKPKRSGRYVQSDDGTMLEVIDEKPDDPDHPEYV
jgi:hypothetical protein